MTSMCVLMVSYKDCMHVYKNVHTECKELYPFTHINALPLHLLHPRQEYLDRVVHVLLEVFERLHGIGSADQPSLSAMDAFVSFCEEIELAVSLPYTVPFRFAELRSRSCMPLVYTARLIEDGLTYHIFS